jgi:hypothetical protein
MGASDVAEGALFGRPTQMFIDLSGQLEEKANGDVRQWVRMISSGS